MYRFREEAEMSVASAKSCAGGEWAGTHGASTAQVFTRRAFGVRGVEMGLMRLAAAAAILAVVRGGF